MSYANQREEGRKEELMKLIVGPGLPPGRAVQLFEINNKILIFLFFLLLTV